MAEEIKEEVVEEQSEEKKKGFFGKAKDALLPDPEFERCVPVGGSHLLSLLVAHG